MTSYLFGALSNANNQGGQAEETLAGGTPQPTAPEISLWNNNCTLQRDKLTLQSQSLALQEDLT